MEQVAGTVKREDIDEREEKKRKREASAGKERTGGKRAEAISGYGKQVDVRRVGGLGRMLGDNSMGGVTSGVGVELSESNRQTIAVKRTGGEEGREESIG